MQLSLTGGTLHVRLRSLGEGESFEIDTPNAAVTLLRAGEYRFFVDADRNLTTVTVRGGDAEVIGGGRAFTLHARDSARLAGADDNFSSQLDPPRWPTISNSGARSATAAKSSRNPCATFPAK